MKKQFLSIYSLCDMPAFLAALHTTMCLDHGVAHLALQHTILCVLITIPQHSFILLSKLKPTNDPVKCYYIKAEEVTKFHLVGF